MNTERTREESLLAPRKRVAAVGARFRDRVDAGRQLAARCELLRGEDAVVLGLPRGGVPVAAEVAQALDVALDVIVVRKVGVPFQPELGMGAIGEGGIRVVNSDVVRAAGISEAQWDAVAATEAGELERRAWLYRRGRPPLALARRVAIVVDDGIATGSTARAACDVARALGAARVVLATPTAAADSLARLRPFVDDVICVITPTTFVAVGAWYDDFTPTTDAEVVDLLG